MSGEPPEDGELNEMTLPCRHGTRNSSPGGLMASSRRLPTILNLSFTAAYVISAIIFIDEKHINKIVKAIQSG